MTAKKNPHWTDLPLAPITLPDPTGDRRDASVAISLVTVANSGAQATILPAKALRDYWIALANQADFAAGGTGSAVGGGVA